ncbi:hypothetical protein AAMO2058_001676800 [Amorphochlora amoebiformis]
MLPQIALETAGRCQVKMVLGLTYMALIAAVVLGNFEPSLMTSTLNVSGGPCTGTEYNNQTFQDCFYYPIHDKILSKSNSSTVWISQMTASKLSLYNAFSIKLMASRYVNSSVISGDKIGIQNIANYTTVRVYGIQNSQRKELLYNKSFEVYFFFDPEQSKSSQLWVLARPAEYLNFILTYNQYSLTWVKDYTTFQIEIWMKDVDLKTLADQMHLEFELMSAKFIAASIVIRIIFQFISLVLIAVWCYKISLLVWRRILPEHFWIGLLLVAEVLNENPMYLPMRWYPHVKWIWYLSTSSLLFSQVLMMVFLMLMVDGMASKHSEHGISFYSTKVIFGLVLLSSTLTVMVISDSDNDNNDTYEKHAMLLEKGTTIHDVCYSSSSCCLSICFILTSTLVLAWSLYILVQLVKTNGKLRRLPYVTTRFRQLSFRFFIYQSVLIIFYFIASYVIILIKTRGNIVQFTNTREAYTGNPIYRYQGLGGTSLSSMILVSIYGWLLAAVYLPSRPLIEYCYHKTHKRRAGTQCTDGTRRSSGQHKSSYSARSECMGGYVLLDSTQDNMLETHCIRVREFSTAKDQSALKEFSLQTATWLTYFADQAYFEVPNTPHAPLSYGEANLPKWFGFRIVKVLRAPGDTYANVAITRDLDAKHPVKHPNIRPDRFRNTRADEPELERSSRQFAKQPVIVVSFRGTVTMENVKTDLDMCSRTQLDGKLTDSLGLIMDRIRGAPKVHRGFWDVYRAVEEPLLTIIKKLAWRAKCLGLKTPKIYCTGHSLGGAISTILAFFIKTRLGLDVEMYSFGAPRVGNHQFQELYDSQVPRSFRVVMDGDFFADTPKLCCLYKHIGSEILLDTAGNLIINPAFVEKALRSSRSSLKNHSLLVYLNALRQATRYAHPRSVRHVGDQIGVNGRSTPYEAYHLEHPLYTPREEHRSSSFSLAALNESFPADEKMPSRFTFNSPKPKSKPEPNPVITHDRKYHDRKYRDHKTTTQISNNPSELDPPSQPKPKWQGLLDENNLSPPTSARFGVYATTDTKGSIRPAQAEEETQTRGPSEKQNGYHIFVSSPTPIADVEPTTTPPMSHIASSTLNSNATSRSNTNTTSQSNTNTASNSNTKTTTNARFPRTRRRRREREGRQRGLQVRDFFLAPGPRITVPMCSGRDAFNEPEFLHPKQTTEKILECELGSVFVYTVPLEAKDDRVQIQVPILH